MAREQAIPQGGVRHEMYDTQVNVSRSPIPLSFVNTGDVVRVKAIRGKDETRRYLANMGFADNTEVSVISELDGNVIVNVKGTRVAISKALANRVLTI